jgi:hypothetical protein
MGSDVPDVRMRLILIGTAIGTTTAIACTPVTVRQTSVLPNDLQRSGSPLGVRVTPVGAVWETLAR